MAVFQTVICEDILHVFFYESIETAEPSEDIRVGIKTTKL